MERKQKNWVLKGPGPDAKLEKSRKQADDAREKVLRMQSMLNRIERFELGEADFRDPSGDFLRDKDIFVDAEDRILFKKACPISFDRIERREKVVAQETKHRLAQETSYLLLGKLKKKLDKDSSPQGALVGPFTSSLASSIAAEAEMVGEQAVTEETKQQLLRTLDDRKADMIEALQMEIVLMINQHKIVDDYQSPVNGSMYSELPHPCVIVPNCARALHHARIDNSFLTPHPSPTCYPSSTIAQMLLDYSQATHRAGDHPLQEANPEIRVLQAHLVFSDSLLHPRA